MERTHIISSKWESPKLWNLFFSVVGPFSKKEMLWTLNATTTTKLFWNHIRDPNDPKWDPEGLYHACILGLVWVLGAQSRNWQNQILIINYGNTSSHITNQASHSIGESRGFCWAIVRPEQNNHERMISSSATMQYYHDGLSLMVGMPNSKHKICQFWWP
jgi:hypothetical protein